MKERGQYLFSFHELWGAQNQSKVFWSNKWGNFEAVNNNYITFSKPPQWIHLNTQIGMN